MRMLVSCCSRQSQNRGGQNLEQEGWAVPHTASDTPPPARVQVWLHQQPRRQGHTSVTSVHNLYTGHFFYFCILFFKKSPVFRDFFPFSKVYTSHVRFEKCRSRTSCGHVSRVLSPPRHAIGNRQRGTRQVLADTTDSILIHLLHFPIWVMIMLGARCGVYQGSPAHNQTSCSRAGRDIS